MKDLIISFGIYDNEENKITSKHNVVIKNVRSNISYDYILQVAMELLDVIDFGEKENEDVRYMGVKTTGIVKTTYFNIN